MIEALLSGRKVLKDVTKKAWSAGTALGQFSLQYASAKVGDTIYLFGGRVQLTSTGRNTAYKYVNDTLTAIANLPQTLAASCAVAIGRKIYIFGGCSQLTAGSENRKVYIYDVDANTYSTGTDMPANSVVGSCAAIGTDIYVYGGMNAQTESGFPKFFYKYDTLAKTWTALPYHDGNAMLSTGCVEIGGLLYCFGGEWNNAGLNENDVRVYDPVAGTWSKLAVTGTRPAARGACGMVKYDDTRFVIVGGRSGSGSNVIADAWIFDVTKLAWTQLATYPSKVSFHRSELVGNNDVVVFDGYNSAGIQPGAFILK